MNLKKIQEAEKLGATRSKWRNDFNSVEYKFCSELNHELFGMPFNKKRNCGCIDDFFLLLKRKILIFEKMEKKFFKLKEGVAYQNPKYGLVTNETSDEVHADLLSKFPVLKKHYAHMDEEGFKSSLKASKTANPKVEKPKTANDTDLTDQNNTKSEEVIPEPEQ